MNELKEYIIVSRTPEDKVVSSVYEAYGILNALIHFQKDYPEDEILLVEVQK